MAMLGPKLRGPGRPAFGGRRRGPALRALHADSSIFPVPLFPSNKVLLPTATGVLNVFEPHFLMMFEELAEKAPGHSLEGVRFGHLLHPDVAPPALLAEGHVGGMPRVGCVATVKKATRNHDGTLTLEYEGSKRMRLLSIWQSQPYMVAAAAHMTDEVPRGEEDLVDGLEQELYRQLRELGRLSRVVPQDGGQAGLPDSVPRYAPPPLVPRSKPQTIADYLTAAGHPAGSAIAMWQRHGSVYGSAKAVGVATPDPYSVMSEQLGKDTRQELFTFAAACMLELGPAEQLALLLSRDRAARLQWISAAVTPFLDELRARASVARALGGGA